MLRPPTTSAASPKPPSASPRRGSSSASCCFRTRFAPSTSRAAACSCAAAFTALCAKPWAHLRQVFRLSAAVRLCTYRTHQRASAPASTSPDSSTKSIDYFHLRATHVHPEYFAAGFAVLVTLYFWRKNIIGIHESSEKALRIMQITTVMVVMLIVWCLYTIITHGYQPVPFPSMQQHPHRRRSAGLAEGHAA